MNPNETINRDAFTGFTFGQYHSSQFNILRVSGGSRYDDEVLPSAKDTTISVAGADGLFYVNSTKSERTFNLQFAYDSLREEDILNIREWLSPRIEQKLIFDERPYKYYWAKVTGAPKFTYICFDDMEDPNKRVYKGEGTVTFTCYYPYAKSVALYQDKTALPTVDFAQWKDVLPVAAPSATSIANYGQLPMPFQVLFSVSSTEYPDGTEYDNIRGSLSLSSNTKKQIYFQTLSKDLDYIYDSDLHLILSIGSDKVTEKKLANFTYSQMEQKNGIILAGDFFSVPVGDKEQTLGSYGLTIHDISYKYIYY